MTTKAPTPEEIAKQIYGEGAPFPTSEMLKAKTLGATFKYECFIEAVAEALRTYGDRRYCEARDAAARVADDQGRAWSYGDADAARDAELIAEAIRKLTP